MKNISSKMHLNTSFYFFKKFFFILLFERIWIPKSSCNLKSPTNVYWLQHQPKQPQDWKKKTLNHRVPCSLNNSQSLPFCPQTGCRWRQLHTWCQWPLDRGLCRQWTCCWCRTPSQDSSPGCDCPCYIVLQSVTSCSAGNHHCRRGEQSCQSFTRLV